ncbi:hypothetical protein BLNAU_15518 [Blattamonas nauphoetae]|uniref:Uncharacterized protein n=1 Tax=Blattamonas nauphoetae TaxID=2049346 RepID=A0ABQ9XAI8_9EUKA|nr:hypothetical protein BLNAU_15518 [Blattamonas nauphoetae]
MWADIDEFRLFFDDSDQLSPEENIERQRDDGQWGGYHEFPYLSRILQKRIAVYSPNVTTPHVIGDDLTIPKLNIGFCNKNHIISLHNVPEDVQPEDTESLPGEEEETEREEMEREAAEQAEEKREDSEGGKLRIQPHRHAKPKVFAGGKTQRKK